MVVGTLTIDPGATFATIASGYVWNGTDTFVFLDNDGSDAITGTFANSNLASFLGSGLPATDSHTSGTGNDYLAGLLPLTNLTRSSPAMADHSPPRSAWWKTPLP